MEIKSKSLHFTSKSIGFIENIICGHSPNAIWAYSGMHDFFEKNVL